MKQMQIDQTARNRLLAKALANNHEHFLDKAITDELFERLTFIKFSPKQILNFSFYPQYSNQLLKKHFSDAEIVSMNIEQDLAKDKLLPYKNQQFDFIFSNLTMQHINYLDQILLDLRRILKPGGLLFFSLLGRDTLIELRNAFAAASQAAHVHDFNDMHDIGDLLLACQFEHPVMDMEQLTINYDQVKTLFNDIKKIGFSNVHSERQRGLLGKKIWQKMLSHYQTINQKVPVTVEIIYGHAWVGQKPMVATYNEQNEAVFPVELLRKNPRT